MIWFLTFLGIWGALLNVRGKWQGFLVWMIMDICLVIHNCLIAEYAQAALFFFYTGLAAYGMSSWFKKKPR